MTVHNFRRSLNKSHSASDNPVWEEIYRRAFPNFLARIDHRQDGAHQRAGIDVSVVLSNAERTLIDEKARFKSYSDIALEYLSDEQRGVPGWVCKDLRANYICYAILPSGIAYLLPVPQLQQAWRQNSSKWMRDYRRIRAHNEGYDTISCGVPPKILFNAMCQWLRFEFSPIFDYSENAGVA